MPVSVEKYCGFGVVHRVRIPLDVVVYLEARAFAMDLKGEYTQRSWKREQCAMLDTDNACDR